VENKPNKTVNSLVNHLSKYKSMFPFRGTLGRVSHEKMLHNHAQNMQNKNRCRSNNKAAVPPLHLIDIQESFSIHKIIIKVEQK